MLPTFDLGTLRFDQPHYLWLLLVPGAFLGLWTWQLGSRRRDTRRLGRKRQLPVRERFPLVGELLFWLCLIVATASILVALARPSARVSFVRTAGVDLVILQDGSASMRVKDVWGDRWQRSMRFLRVLAESLSWNDDRIAMALFAHIAAPQVRLTKDPNTFFFFLDHLDEEPPFRLEDDTTWDTNIELGVYWGLRLLDKDQELHGKSPNSAVFVLVSDGQAWSGEVEKSLKQANERGVPVVVVGVGTAAGGFIPEPARQPGEPVPAQAPSPVHAELDRTSLEVIAAADGGQYFELDRQPDRDIANAIIDSARRRSRSRDVEETTVPLYWQCLAAAAVFACAGVLFLRDRAQLWIQVAAAAGALLIVSRLVR